MMKIIKANKLGRSIFWVCIVLIIASYPIVRVFPLLEYACYAVIVFFIVSMEVLYFWLWIGALRTGLFPIDNAALPFSMRQKVGIKAKVHATLTLLISLVCVFVFTSRFVMQQQVEEQIILKIKELEHERLELETELSKYRNK